MTQARLAAELGVSTRLITAYEIGEKPIPRRIQWALVGLLRPLRSQLRLEARRRRYNEARQRRREQARRLAAIIRVETQQRRARRRFLSLAARAFRRAAGPTPEELRQLNDLIELKNRPLEAELAHRSARG